MFRQHLQAVTQTMAKQAYAVFGGAVINQLMNSPVNSTLVNQFGNYPVYISSSIGQLERGRICHDTGVQTGGYIFVYIIFVLENISNKIINQLRGGAGINIPVSVIIKISRL